MRSHLPGMPESASCLPFSVSKFGSFWQQISYLLLRVNGFVCVAREHCFCDDDDNNGGRQIQPAVVSSQWWQQNGGNLLDFSFTLTHTQSHWPSLLCDVIPDFLLLFFFALALAYFRFLISYDLITNQFESAILFLFIYSHTHTNTNASFSPFHQILGAWLRNSAYLFTCSWRNATQSTTNRTTMDFFFCFPNTLVSWWCVVATLFFSSLSKIMTMHCFGIGDDGRRRRW